MITRSARLCVGELCNYYVVQSTVVQSERSGGFGWVRRGIGRSKNLVGTKASKFTRLWITF